MTTTFIRTPEPEPTERRNADRRPRPTTLGTFVAAVASAVLLPPSVLPHPHWDMGDLQDWRER